MFFAASIFFALNGITFGSWAARVPDIARDLQLTPATLGAALFCISLGALASMQVTGFLCARFGSRRVGQVTVPCFATTLPLPALAGNLPELCGALLVFGLASGAANVAANSLGVEVEARAKRPMMSSLHAVFSLGGLVGSAAGGVLAGLLPAVLHLSSVAGVCLLVCAWLTRVIDKVTGPAREPSPRRRRARHSKTEPAGSHLISVNLLPEQTAPSLPGRFSSHTAVIITLGGIAACTAFAEGALGDWGALHLRENLHASPGLAAAGYALFSLAMAIGRMAGHRLVARLGDTRMLLGGTLLAAGGTLAVSFGASLPIALSGFLMVGLGLANVFPLAIGRAGVLNGAKGVGLAATVGYVGPLAGPPLIGLLAGQAGLRTALSGVGVLVLLASVLSVVVAVEAPRATSVAAAWRVRYARTRDRAAVARTQVTAVRRTGLGLNRATRNVTMRLGSTATRITVTAHTLGVVSREQAAVLTLSAQAQQSANESANA
ncbi:MFS transporter [Kineosporia sp. NBRC 101731]|uniref:MFS transporter n=1 Tax=Kineosporia sp. NBRC 101731 TaxID=3032199 RepID=UPI0024A5EF40|nr:MFS transporter [Kineosporia sp. NBRC 101731]GLY30013.1 MFS transporter [Kineosporia sp. NBRC 101731]